MPATMLASFHPGKNGALLNRRAHPAGCFCCLESFGLSGSGGEDRIGQCRGAGRAPDEKLLLVPADGPGIRIGCACVSSVRWADEDTGGHRQSRGHP